MLKTTIWVKSHTNETMQQHPIESVSSAIIL